MRRFTLTDLPFLLSLPVIQARWRRLNCVAPACSSLGGLAHRALRHPWHMHKGLFRLCAELPGCTIVEYNSSLLRRVAATGIAAGECILAQLCSMLDIVAQYRRSVCCTVSARAASCHRLVHARRHTHACNARGVSAPEADSPVGGRASRPVSCTLG